MAYHEALAENFTVYAPSHPGYDGSQSLSWINSIAALSHYYLGLVQHLGWDRFSVVGFSMGGWLAAEMAAMCPHGLDRLVLVGAVGIRPREGEIAELFNVSREAVEKLRFYDPGQVPDYDRFFGRELTPEERGQERLNREMGSRLCWKPYMHNPNLPHFLTKVSTPTMVVWGREDAIVPVECGGLYKEALPKATLKVIDNCGHAPQSEKPSEFLDIVVPFLRGS
jgi:pimeloyl-ACP methyl ester carboxylesterase